MFHNLPRVTQLVSGRGQCEPLVCDSKISGPLELGILLCFEIFRLSCLLGMKYSFPVNPLHHSCRGTGNLIGVRMGSPRVGAGPFHGLKDPHCSPLGRVLPSSPSMSGWERCAFQLRDWQTV